MTFPKAILLLISLSMIAALVACGSSSSTPPPPPPPPILANGNYAFSLSGIDNYDNDGTVYYVAGVFTVLNGAITGGEQDFADFDIYAQDPISAAGSSIKATADGNLKIVLATGDANIGVNFTGVETLDASVLPLSTTGKALITEYDSSATSSGVLESQNTAVATAALPAFGYAFVVNGVDSDYDQLSIGGVIDVDNLGGTTGTISGAGSIFDANDGGGSFVFPSETFGASSVTGPTANPARPDAFGRVEFTLNPTDNVDFPQIILVGYIVDANHIRLVETADTYEGTTGGVAYSQGQANTGQFSSASASVSGVTYVAGLNGIDCCGVLQVATQLTLNAGGTVSGFVDFSDLTGSDTFNPDAVSAAAYTVDGPLSGLSDAGTGRVQIPGLADATDVASYNLYLYLDGNGHALALTLDEFDVLGGVGYQQGAGPFTAGSFSGHYGMDVTGWDADYDGEFDAVGPVVATGSGGTFAGTADFNWLNFDTGPITVAPATVSGTFNTNGAAAANGIFSSGSITGVDVTTCAVFGGVGCTADVFDYYLIDATGDNIAIETDTNQLTLGSFTQQ
jgi:hypothetical protein